MKKLFIILTVAMVGCQDIPSSVTVNPVTETHVMYGLKNQRKSIEILVIDEHQYVGHFSGGQSDWGTHKADCNNPIHNVKGK